MAREPLADAFFGFPDTEEADLGFVTDALGLLEYPAFVVDKDLRIITLNLQGRDTLAWIASANPGDTEENVLPPVLARFVTPRLRKRVHDVVKDVTVITDPLFLFDLFISKGRIRGQTYTFLVLMTASTGRRPKRRTALGRLLEGFRGGAFVGDRDVHFVEINDAFLDLIGFKREELLGHHMNEFNTSEQAMAYAKVFGAMIESPRALFSPAVTYSTMRRGAFVTPMTAWTMTDKNGEAVGLAIVGGVRSRPRPEAAQIERGHVLLEKAADLMKAAIFITDLDGDILVKNTAAEGLIKAGAALKERLNIKTDVPWENPETLEDIFEGLAEGREQTIFNTGIMLPSDKAIFKVRIYALKRVSDVIQEVVFVCDNISQEEFLKQRLFQTTRRLAEDRALLDRVLNSIDIPYLIVDEDLTVLDANEAVARRFVKPRGGLAGMKLTDVNPNLEKTGMLDHIRIVFASGEVTKTKGRKHVTHDGRELTLNTTVVPVELRGRKVCVLLAEGETQAAAEVERVRLNSAITEAIMQEAREGIFIIDKDGTFLSVSDGAAKGSNLPREYIEGKNVNDLIALAEEEDMFRALWEKILTIEEPFRSGVVKSRSRVDDSMQFVDCYVNPLKGPRGTVEKYLIIIHYLGEMKSLEEKVADYTANLEQMVKDRTRELRDSNALLASTAERVGRTARSGDMLASLKDRESVIDAFLRQGQEVIQADYIRLVIKRGASSGPRIEERSRGAESGMDEEVQGIIDEAMDRVTLDSSPRERVWSPADNLLVGEFASGSENGVFVCFREKGRFTSIDVDLAHLLCTQLSFALPAANYVAEQRRGRDRAECIRRIAFRIAGVTSVKEAVQAVAAELSEVVSADRFFWLVKEDTGRVWVTEIYRRDRPTDGRSAHVELSRGEEDWFSLFDQTSEEVSCERLSAADGARSAQCKFISSEAKTGIVKPICESMHVCGFVEKVGAECAVVRMQLAQHSPSYICARREAAEPFTDDEICFMCLAASSVGRVWSDADAASTIRRLITTGRTIAEVAHDIKYPMGKVAELIGQIASGEMGLDETIEAASSILPDAETLAHLSREFVELYKPASDKPEFIDLVEVLSENLALARSDLDRKSVTVDMESGDEPLPPVFVSRSDLSRVLINLIANAHQAVEDGGWIKINAFVDRRDERGPTVALTFQNSGPLVPEDLRDGLFNPFKSGKKGGTGLGLFSARRRVGANGGDLAYEVDEDGVGRFKVSFPAALE